MKQKLQKAYEITDAKIQFVSLVDKAANKRQFLLTKAEAGQASFTSYGRIIQKDAKHHYVTGIVYEPMQEDSQGNFMTEEEITKAAYWFAKNGDKVDLQHSFEPLPGAAVVENWIAKADFEVEGQPVKKGSWLMTVEVTDDEVWAAIEQSQITGFSMGGIGNYSEENVELQKQGLLQQLAAALGFGDKSAAMPEKEVQKEKGDEILTKQELEQVVAAAVSKAMGDFAGQHLAQNVEQEQAADEQPVTVGQLQEMVNKAVVKAMEPLLQSRGLPSNLNDNVQKAAGEPHYLHGIL